MPEPLDGDVERKSRELAKRSAKLQLEAAMIRAKSDALVAKAKQLQEDVAAHRKRLARDRKSK